MPAISTRSTIRGVECGLTPLQALQASLLAGPRFFGLERRYGSIEPGREADLLLLERNPLEDIHATRSIEGVVLHGRYLDRDTLDRLLNPAPPAPRAGATTPVRRRPCS